MHHYYMLNKPRGYISARRDETLLFNAENKAVNATVNGKKVKVEAYSLKSVK